MTTKQLSFITLCIAFLCLPFIMNAAVIPHHNTNPTKEITALHGETTFYFSPITAIGVGPNGLATQKINVSPYCCPSTAIQITSKTRAGVGEKDFQWVLIPLSLPRGVITNVNVCYSIKSEKESAYISQTRITSMTTPNRAMVRLDDGTNRGSQEPTCYNVKKGIEVDGTMTLALKVVLGAGDQIRIGSISVDMKY